MKQIYVLYNEMKNLLYRRHIPLSKPSGSTRLLNTGLRSCGIDRTFYIVFVIVNYKINNNMMYCSLGTKNCCSEIALKAIIIACVLSMSMFVIEY